MTNAGTNQMRMPSGRHSSETLAVALLMVTCGAVLLYLSHLWGVGMDLMSGLGAVAGPVAVALGAGMAIHGKHMPRTHISLAARCWGTCGSVGAWLHLLHRGYFEHRATSGVARYLIPMFLIAVWWLPAAFYGPEQDRHVGGRQPDRHDPNA